MIHISKHALPHIQHLYGVLTYTHALEIFGGFALCMQGTSYTGDGTPYYICVFVHNSYSTDAYTM